VCCTVGSAPSRSPVAGWYVDGVFSWKGARPARTEREERVPGWAVSPVGPVWPPMSDV
jgi:hypothetical protein